MRAKDRLATFWRRGRSCIVYRRRRSGEASEIEVDIVCSLDEESDDCARIRQKETLETNEKWVELSGKSCLFSRSPDLIYVAFVGSGASRSFESIAKVSLENDQVKIDDSMADGFSSAYVTSWNNVRHNQLQRLEVTTS